MTHVGEGHEPEFIDKAIGDWIVNNREPSYWRVAYHQADISSLQPTCYRSRPLFGEPRYCKVLEQLRRLGFEQEPKYWSNQALFQPCLPDSPKGRPTSLFRGLYVVCILLISSDSLQIFWMEDGRASSLTVNTTIIL